jgi:hypothetical protein
MPERLQAIREELERAAGDYIAAKKLFARAQVEFEAAREKFAGVRQLASDMMTGRDWYTWRDEHAGVRYACMPLGEAIADLLRDYAYDQAERHVAGKADQFRPYMALSEIAAELEAGGYDFKTTTPMREVNAALIRLSEAVRSSSWANRYAHKDAPEILEQTKARVQTQGK